MPNRTCFGTLAALASDALLSLPAAALAQQPSLTPYAFPFETNAVTRMYFSCTAPLVPADLASDTRAVSASDTPDSTAATRLAARSAFYNAELRTTTPGCRCMA